jgi:hypothetical protein
MRRRWTPVLAALVLVVRGTRLEAVAERLPSPAAIDRPKLGDAPDGSRGTPAHVIPLRDENGEIIRPGDRPLLPFSTRTTCGGECHDVARIAHGWHFNAALPGVPSGRRGQPWVLVDLETATRLPISYRSWPGAARPAEVGISRWWFAKLFGARTPGGIAEAASGGRADRQARWEVSGELEVNCLACHDGSPAYDHAEYVRQIGLENFRWAAAAASGIAHVTGSAREMPDTYDYLLPVVEDGLAAKQPAVAYAPGRFLPGGKVGFDIVREVPPRRCYACHSNADTGDAAGARWNRDEDVHVARGMRCVDCHGNGLDHAIVRGDQGELSCRGCHESGRLGAPSPAHAGLPAAHLTRLSCTACHSGPRPETAVRSLKTSQTHLLGTHIALRAAAALPHLYYPVFAGDASGTITPNRLVWPAFWGRVDGKTVKPLPPGEVRKSLARAKLLARTPSDSSWPAIDDDWVVRGLLALESAAAAPSPVYVAGGAVHRVNAEGALVLEPHGAAAPYLWPIAHDVRPAARALGAGGCEDCHSAGAPIVFGSVAVDSPLPAERVRSWPMHRFEKGLDPAAAARLAATFPYRPWLKAGGILTAAVMGLLLLVEVGRAREQLARGVRRASPAVNLFALASAAAAAITGFAATPLSGSRLLAHVAVAPLFALGAALAVLTWNGAGQPSGPRLSGLRSLLFWLTVAAAVPVVLSMTLAMLPLAGPGAQDQLVRLHRYSAFLLVGLVPLLTAVTVADWLTRRQGGA